MLIDKNALREFTEGSFEHRRKMVKNAIKDGQLPSEIGCTKLVACFEGRAIICNEKGKLFECKLEWSDHSAFLQSVEPLGELEGFSGNFIRHFLEAKAEETVKHIVAGHDIKQGIKVLMQPENDERRTDVIIKRLHSIVNSNNLWGKSLCENEGDILRLLWSKDGQIKKRNKPTNRFSEVFVRSKNLLERLENISLSSLGEHKKVYKSLFDDCKSTCFWLSKVMNEKIEHKKHGYILQDLVECLNNMDTLVTFLSDHAGGENRYAALS